MSDDISLRDSDSREQNGSSAATDYVLSVIRGRRGLIPGIIRLVLSCLAVIYASGLRAYLLLYRVGIRRATRLPCPVVCVGNLTFGGTGKTPTTQMICRLLAGQGKRVAIIIRGYGGEYEHDCGLVSDGERVLMTARQSGDEAYLLARTLPGVAVAVGRDRIRTGRLVIETCRPDVIVMDDGMQHWRLHRDLDIVLLNACEPFGNGWTLPRGLLREPRSHVRRAGIILLTNARRAGDEKLERVRAEVALLAPGRPIFTGDLSPAGLLDIDGENLRDERWLDGRRICAVSALGNPDSFESMLRDQGAILALKYRFRDHHAITAGELEDIAVRAAEAGAEAIVTTEKDAVKLRVPSGGVPFRVLRVNMCVSDSAAFLSAILERVGRAKDARSQPRLKLS